MKKLVVIVVLFLLPFLLFQPRHIRVHFFDSPALATLTEVIQLEGYKLKVVEAALVIDDVLFDEKHIMFIFVRCLKVDMDCYYGFVVMTRGINWDILELGPLDGYDI